MIHLDVYCKMKRNEKRNNTEDVKKKLILSSNSEQKEYTFEKKKYLGCQMHGTLVYLKILSSKFGTWNNSL